MALDLIARAVATSAQTAAAQALARTAALDLFSTLGARAIDASIATLLTAGYAAPGSGAGTYVSDALATAALAAAHPRFCKQTANGRYFRFAGDFVTVEQAGAVGAAGTNDQPAIQAAIDYALALGIAEVRFTRPAYDLWCPLRTSGTFGPGWAGLRDGYPIYINGSISLLGLNGGSTLRFLNSTGGVKTSGLQATAWGTWYGGGIWVDPNSSVAATNIDHIRLENLILDGTVPYVAANGNVGANTSDKGLGFPSNGNNVVLNLTMRNVTVHNFCGELFYGGCFNGSSVTLAENCEFYNSNQSAWNPTGTGKVVAVNLIARDSYLPSEIILGQGHTYVGGYFARGSNAGSIGTQFFAGGYNYTYPNRDTAKQPAWVTFIGTTFEKISTVNLTSWMRGTVTSIDCSWTTQNQNEQDICLDIDFVIDQVSCGITVAGPSTLTNPYPLTPAGVYQTPPKNISLRIRASRTALAVANNKVSNILTFSNLVDKNTVRAFITGECGNAGSAFTLGATPAGFAVPYVHVDPGFNPADTTRRMGGPYDDVLADKLYKVSWPALSLNPQGTGPYTISLDNTFGYVAGQQVTFFYGSNTSQVLVFPATGAGMKLPQTRKLLGRGDKLVLKWDQSAATWVEELYEISSSQLVLSGSATYDAPSIAAGASASTTVTVTGAALGDYVERISLGASAAGLTVTGYVSAANTVAVVLANMTGAAVDLPSTTLAAEVRKKV